MAVKTPEEIRRIGIKALTQTLGPAGMVRFMHQFDLGTGDYTQERNEWLKDLTINEITEEIQKNRTHKTKKKTV